MARVILKRGRSQPVLYRHPWVYSGGVERIEGECADGDAVEVTDHLGRLLAHGIINRAGRIAVRLHWWANGQGPSPAPGTWDLDELARRLEAARVLREEVLGLPERTDAMRLVHGEGDGLGGLVLDRYADVLVVQVSSLAMERVKQGLIELLRERFAPRAIYERGDADMRREEGLPPAQGFLFGEDGPLEVVEDGLRLAVNLTRGQKTGLYLDQRDNRLQVRALAAGRRVLDACCYTGGFALSAAAGGAREVLAFDRSKNALAAAEANAAANGHAVRFFGGELFETLRELRARGERFDLICLDPPAFAPARRHLRKALEAYRELNGLAVELLAPDGLLVSCSCSKHVDDEAFARALNEGAVQAGRGLAVIERRGQAPDHPVAASCPEGRYLKCYVCRAL